MKKLVLILMTLLSSIICQSASAQRITLPNGQTPFFSGMNVAWRNFANDAADTPADLNDWKKVLDDVKNAGGNCVRWWVFVNASKAPKFNGNGYVSGLGSQSINNVKAVLDLAKERNMVVILCLLSFDMLQTSQGGVNEGNNKKMLQTDAGIKACVDNCIVPLVTAIGKHPSILCWEIFNEPEGMADFAWTPTRVGMWDIQRFVNRAAGAIHRAVPGVLVSNGSWNMKVLCNKLGYKNYYSNQELKNAGGDSDGYLDFYMVHYYNNDGGDNTQHSPFHHSASYWGLDKPILVAEYAAKGVDNPYLTPTDCYKKAYDNNYAGSLSWTYTRHDGLGGLPEATAGMSYLKNNHLNDVTIDFSPVSTQANLALNKPVIVTSTEADLGNNANLAVDGNKTTRWSSEYSDPQSITVNLQKQYSINEISILWEAAYASEYTVEVSTDNKNWINVLSETNGQGGLKTIPVSNETAQYVKMSGTKRTTIWGYSIYELQVFGDTIRDITTQINSDHSADISIQYHSSDKQLYISNLKANEQIYFFNALGQLIYSTYTNQYLTVNTNSWSKGLYIIKTSYQNTSAYKILIK